MNDLPEAPRLEYPPGATKVEKNRLLREWAPKMELWRHMSCLESGQEWMTWLSCDDDHVCEHCAKANGVPVKAIHLDVLKHMRGCTNPNGCRCICGPIPDPHGPSAEKVKASLAAKGITITMTMEGAVSKPKKARRKTARKAKAKVRKSKLYDGIGTDSCGIATYKLD